MKDKPSFPARLSGWEYQYERAEKLQQQNADLVEVLQSIHDWCETDTAADALPFEPPWYKQLRDALAKAEK